MRWRYCERHTMLETNRMCRLNSGCDKASLVLVFEAFEFFHVTPMCLSSWNSS